MRIVSQLEETLFGRRALVLWLIAAFTLAMAWYAAQLRMDAGFEKQLPIGHEYVQTFEQYQGELFGANRLTIVVRAREGSIWTAAGLERLHDVTQAVQQLPSVDRLGAQSLWTPNSFVSEITEDGFSAEPLIDGTITPGALNAGTIARIRDAARRGGFVGTLVSRDESSAMITADLYEVDRNGDKLDYIAYNHLLEERIREPFEDADFEVQIIGFAKQIGDIADGASSVLLFCVVALLLTTVAVYWYCHSWRFTLLPIVCSLTSLVWQFGTLRLLGFGLDPLGVLVPFLVFAIGVSHGVQQINFILRELSGGATTEAAARHSFSGLLVPGVLALLTAFVSFITLVMIPIPMVRELAIAAAIGVGYKIVTNLVMLPLAASYFNFTQAYAEDAMRRRASRSAWLSWLARVARPRNAAAVLAVTAAVFAMAVWQSHDRVVGTLGAGAPELRPDARFNRDAVAITENYDTGLDWLSVVFEAPPGSCGKPEIAAFQDIFDRRMQDVPGVLSVSSHASQLRAFNAGYNEGYPAMGVVPMDPDNYGALGVEIARVRGYVNQDCSMSATHLYLADHKAETIARVIGEVKQFRAAHLVEGVAIRLAAGNAGVLAAVDEEVERSELPMMLYVYAAIAILVLLAYRDWRAVLSCCLPLTVGTFIGYWFMKELDIGLTVATLPVMVLAAGIGVDYAFYIYNRIQLHLASGAAIAVAVERALREVGIATIFTAITLAIGVATWSFSELKFQADMGKLLAFMFMVNLVMAMTALPALAVILERLFPRRTPVRASGMFAH